MTSLRERLGWALLFSLPVGAGIGLATSRVAAVPLDDPLVVGSGLLFASVLFALVFGAVSVNQDEPPEPSEH